MLHFELGSQGTQAGLEFHVADDDLELLTIILPSECWGFRPEPLPCFLVFFLDFFCERIFLGAFRQKGAPRTYSAASLPAN